MIRFAHMIVALLASSMLVSCFSTPHKPFSQASVEIEKSPADKSEYRYIVLKNGLQVMLVSDPQADRSAAALDVHVGSGHDPLDRQGLAHYLEHMLFLGTQKYPEAGEYQQFIAEHGGSNNAYTTLQHTNYFFNIAPDHFEGGLDRFAQFFIAPLFNEAYVKRERSIVHSEYMARKKDKGRRLFTARRMVYNPQHPSTKFSVGNIETLADRADDPVRDDLIAFYQRYYHAPRMALAVVSKHSIDQLQNWVESKFSAISSEGEAYQPFTSPLVEVNQLPVQLTLKPLKETRGVSFSFPIESIYPYEATKPTQYLSNLLGHEGEGSLLAALKARAWANSLSAGLGYSDDMHATFDIKIGLSEQGMAHIDEIGSLLFSSIELIRQQGIKQEYYDEIKQLAELDFKFQEKMGESTLVQRVASLLHRYQPREVLSAPYRFETFNAEHVEHILQKLTPNNLQLIVTDPKLDTTQNTTWYDVGYKINTIDADRLAQWQRAQPVAEIHLPKLNPFIPDRLEMLSQADQTQTKPIKLKQIPGLQVWHQTLLDFAQPKAELYFTLRSKQANASARQAVLTELYVKAIEESLNVYTYPAYLAGLEYEIYRHSRGLSVRISGYSAKQERLLQQIVQHMEALQIDQQQFDLYVENIRQKLQNKVKGRPSDVVIQEVYDVFLTSSWSNDEKLAALSLLTLNDLTQHAKALLLQPDILVLSVGNVSDKDSLKMGEVVSQLLPQPGAQQEVARAKIRKLDRGKWTLREVKAAHEDAAIALIFQGESDEIEELAATQMLAALMRPPYYQALRTEAEIGYIVSAFAFNLLETPALGFSVQSNTHSVEDIVAHTDAFLRTYRQTLTDLPDASFAATKAGLISQISRQDKQLSDIASRYWSELDRKAYDFDTRERLIAAIQALDQTQLSVYLDRLVDPDEGAALLSYSFGDKAAVMDLENKPVIVRYDSLAGVRQAVRHYF